MYGQVRLKPDCSTMKTTLNADILHVASLTLPILCKELHTKCNDKGIDQTARNHRLCCFYATKPFFCPYLTCLTSSDSNVSPDVFCSQANQAMEGF